MSKPSIAFFGATGGCAAAALTLALQSGYDCTALARTPAKLTDLLKTKGVLEHAMATHLAVVQGNVHDGAAVSRVLQKAGGGGGGNHAIIVFGIGGAPKMSNPLRPALDDPVICQGGMAVVLDACRALRAAAAPGSYTPPLLIAVSSTGIHPTRRDIPLAMVPLYRWMLVEPHADKKAMEEKIEAAGKEAGLLRDWIIVQPALLMNGKPKGHKKVHAGYEGRKETGTDRWGDCNDIVVGYTVNRDDVGAWIFEEGVEREGGEWVGQKVTLAEMKEKKK